MSSKADFEDERYLQPSIQDDALLFCLDELSTNDTGKSDSNAQSTSDSRVQSLQDELADLRLKFDEYRAMVEKTLDDRWTSADGQAESSSRAQKTDAQLDKEYEDGYFESYSYNGMSRVLLNDQ